MVLKLEVGLASLQPHTLKVKVAVGALLKLVIDHLGLLVALEPRQEPLVEPPRPRLEFLGRQILMVRSLAVVENVE